MPMNPINSKKVLVITGPTATGKTSVSIELAKQLGGEIISADSMQVYRHMDIGTAKPSAAERQGIPHHMIDVVEPDEAFSVARFKREALNHIKTIISASKVPLVVGGTGQYISALISNINYSETYIDDALRDELRKLAELKGNEYLHNELAKIDHIAAERIHSNDVKRVIRAIEVFRQTQKPMSYHLEQSRLEPPEYEFEVFGLTMDRGEMYERIDRRVDVMLQNGLADEVRELIFLGFSKANSMQGLGYKELCWYLSGRATFDEAVALLKRNTRRFAKRQMTWFRRMKEINWIQISGDTKIVEILNIINKKVASSGIFL